MRRDSLILPAIAAAVFALSGTEALPDSTSAQTAEPDSGLLRAVQQRRARDKKRDVYRHPVETLTWLGIRSDMTVVEIWPGRGWYRRVLEPYLAGGGRYLAAQPKRLSEIPEGTADAVLTFRNLHNWMDGGYAQSMFEWIERTLKPGGIAGVVEHRGNPDEPQHPRALSGYVTEAYVIALAEAAGLELVGKSEINANPDDTKDYPRGVWTLPPSLELGRSNREKYLAIGESDRMTLKFRKPE